MKKIILYSVLLVLLKSEISYSINTYFFRTSGSGNWNDLIWERSTDGGATWGISAVYPLSGDNDTVSTITIRSGHHVNV